MVPNKCVLECRGHEQNVKCVHFIGADTTMLATGSSDATVRLWNLPTFDPSLTSIKTTSASAILTGHQARVWDIHSHNSGHFIASGSADATIKVLSVFDVYCFRFGMLVQECARRLWAVTLATCTRSDIIWMICTLPVAATTALLACTTLNAKRS